MTRSGSRSRPDRRAPAGASGARYFHACFWIALALASASKGAEAQDGGARNVFAVEPFVSVRETFTDNNRLSSTNKESDFITQASAGVSMRANTERLRGFVDYTLTGILYANDTADNKLQNALNAFVTGEVVSNLAYIDLAANVSQQSVSAFGTQSPDSALGNPNRTEVTTFSASPYLRGTLGALVDYEARLSYIDSNSDRTQVSDVTTTSALLRLQREVAFGPFGWRVEGSRRVIDFSAGRENEEDRAQAELTWTVNTDLRLTGIAGRESNNFVTTQKQARDVYGARLVWSPSARTEVLLEKQRRFFGDAHVVSVNYRTPRTVWTYADTRNVQTSQGQPRLGSVGGVFDLFYRQFESIEPNPVLRQLLVLNFLNANGIDPSAQIIAAFLTSAVTLQRNQQLAMAWRGARDTLVVTLSRLESRRLDRLTAPADDFSNTDLVDQRGLVVNLTRRLSARSTLSLVGGLSRSQGATDALETTLRTVTLAWASSLSTQFDVSAGARHARFSSPTSPYDETAVFASLTYRF